MEINQQQLEQDILNWIVNFVEVRNPALGDWPPCPYARQARLRGSYAARIGTNPLDDLRELAESGMGNLEVIAIAYDPEQYPHDVFSDMLDQANRDFLLDRDIIVLEDHPGDLEIVNGVCMNQGTYALALVQSLSDLNKKAKFMARQGFYDAWPEDYLTMLFQHREDPRK